MTDNTKALQREATEALGALSHFAGSTDRTVFAGDHVRAVNDLVTALYLELAEARAERDAARSLYAKSNERLTAAQADAARLDWLDAANLPMRMGWKVGQAPAGNVSVTSVIFLGSEPVNIRAAIDAALASGRDGGRES